MPSHQIRKLIEQRQKCQNDIPQHGSATLFETLVHERNDRNAIATRSQRTIYKQLDLLYARIEDGLSTTSMERQLLSAISPARTKSTYQSIILGSEL